MKKLLFSLIIFFNCVISSLSINYDKEWNRVDDLMDKVKLKDAKNIVDKINNAAIKENNARQLLHAEIYSYAIDMGCEYSLKNKSYVHYPNNYNPQETPKIIETHYNKSIQLLDILGDGAEKYLCQYYIAYLIETCLGFNHNSSNNVRDVSTLSLGEMSFKEQNNLLNQWYLTIANSFEKLDTYKATDYPDLLSLIKEEEGTLADVVVMNVLKSGKIRPYDKYIAVDQLEKADDKSPVDLFLTRMILLQKKKGNKDAIAKYELMRINLFRSNSSYSNKKMEDMALSALDALVAMCPNTDATIKAEALRAKLILDRYDNKKIIPDAKSLEELEHRLLNTKEKIKDERMLEPINEVLDRLHRHELKCETRSVYHSSEPIKIFVSNANVKNVVVSVKRSPYSPQEYQISKRMNRDEYYVTSDSSKRLTDTIPYTIDVPLKQDTFALSKSRYNHMVNDTLSIDNLTYGAYMLKIKDADDLLNEDSLKFVVSDLAVVTGIIDNNKRHITVYTVDYLSGKPIEKVSLYYDEKPVSKETTDASGKISIKESAIYKDVRHQYFGSSRSSYWNNTKVAIYPVKGEDGYSQPLAPTNAYESEGSGGYATSVMTDRSVYRPGQTVKFWGFYTYAGKKKDCIVPHRTLYLSLKDKSGKAIKDTIVKTNEFGKFSGEFKIDDGDDAIGVYDIYCDNQRYCHRWYGDASFRVEDYKLPQFEVELDKNKDRYQIKDSIIISGKAHYYSGEPVLNAKVELSIEDEDYELTTDSLGCFSAIYTIDEDYLERDELSLEIEAEVMSPSGEVVELKKNITIYRDDVKFWSYPDNLNLAKNSEWYINCYNHEDYNSKSCYSYTISDPVTLSADLLFVSKKDGKVNDRQTKLLNGQTKLDLSKLPIGDYEVVIIDSEKGDTLTKRNVVVYDSRSKINPVVADFWVSDNHWATVGEHLTYDLSIASNDSDVYVLYQFADNNGKILKEEWINLKNELRTIKYSSRELFTRDRDKAYIVSLFIYKNGKYISNCLRLNKYQKPKNLTANINRLRDKIHAGSPQKWTIEIDGTDLPLSLAATMYDAALDVYGEHVWSPKRAYYSPYFYNTNSYFSSFNFTVNRSRYQAWQYPYKNSDDLRYSIPVWSIDQTVNNYSSKSIYTSADFKGGEVVYGYVRNVSGDAIPYANVHVDSSFVNILADQNGYYQIHIPNKGCYLTFSSWGAYESKRIFVDKFQRLDVVLDYSDKYNELTVTGYGVQKKSDVTGSVCSLSSSASAPFNIHSKTHEIVSEETKADKSNHKGNHIRANFSETAFFFPDIRTHNGKATIKFDAPEGISRWNIKIVSLSKKVHLGNDNFEVKTTMPFTVRPLLPRVFRVGDTCVVAATISSNDGNSVRGKAKFLFEDNATGKILADKSMDFSVSANKSQTVDCQFVVPNGVENVKLTVTADGPKFSDGELHLIPVIPNRSKVIKAQSSMVRKGESKMLSVDADNASNVDLTFEYVPNSVWQAILAMPSVSTPENDDAFDCAKTLYINSIAADLAANNPSILNILSKWKSDSLVVASPLLRDDELKSVSIDATPWRQEAMKESEQRAQIVVLMEKKNTDKLSEKCLEKLKKLQTEDGGFSWFYGAARSNEYVTAFVVRYLTKLHQRNLLSEDGENMLAKALPAIDRYLLKEFNRYKERSYSLKASNFELMMMFSRLTTLDIVPVSEEVKHSFDFITKNTEEHWHDLTLHGKACFARILMVQHKDSLAKQIVEAMRQTYIKSDTLGIYWKENQDYFSWYNNSIAVHAEAVRAFIETGAASKEEIAEMQLWLLRKRETTVWRSPVATVDAIDLLVSTSSLDTEGGKVTLPNGETIESKDECAFIKRTLSSSDLKNSIKVDGAKDCIGFASIYASYDADNSKITPASNYISIEKKTYRHEKRKTYDGNTEDVLTEVKEGDVVNLGDKLEVVMTVDNEQDLDFVLVKDERPACLEPQKEVSGYKWRNGNWFYQIITDNGIRMFFDRLKKGKYSLSYTLFVQSKGTYSSGVSTAECMYSPSFRGNSDCGVKIVSSGQ